MKSLNILILVLLAVTTQYNNSFGSNLKNKNIHLSIELSPELKNSMTSQTDLVVTTADDFFNPKYYPLVFKNNKATIDLEAPQGYLYIMITFTPVRNLALNDILFLAGDSLNMVVNSKDDYTFTANNSLFDCQIELQNVIYSHTYSRASSLQSQHKNNKDKMDLIVEKYKSKTDPFYRQLVEINFASRNTKIACLGIENMSILPNIDSALANNIANFREYIARNYISQTSLDILSKSPDYITNLFHVEQFKGTSKAIKVIKDDWQKAKGLRFNYMLESINENFSDGIIRERLLCLVFLSPSSKYSDQAMDLLNNTIPTIKDTKALNTLLALKKSRNLGTPAFDFNFEGEDGKMHSLKDFKGKVIVAIFYTNGCDPCARLHKFLEPWKVKFLNNKNIEFVTIYADHLKERWLANLKTGIYTSSTDVNLWVGKSGSHHPILEYYKYTGVPQILLIDKAGKVISSNPERPYNEESLQKFENLITSFM